ncbi:DUF4926 domain-containing protein [Thermoanaerobacterium saccharolyticum]|uniref:DUF4926 domain-containing protein n=1 Tax=Thermoanaerobacterium saccharolyticum TaxID=28896 RepID=UPI0009E3EC66
MEIDVLDVVKLKDGREGTVVHKYHAGVLPQAYEIEFNDNTETIKENEIDKVLWRAKAH